MKTRVVLADDHVSIREMLARILALEGTCEVVGHAGTGLEALRCCREERPDLLILDLVLPEICGAEVTRCLRQEFPGLRVLIYTGAGGRPMLLEALQAHPHGLVSKADGLEVLREAIRAVCAGRSYFSGFASELLVESRVHAVTPLSGRERQVLHLIAGSRTTKQIALLLNIATKTVEHHRERLMQKLGLHDIAALTRYAVQQGMVE